MRRYLLGTAAVAEIEETEVRVIEDERLANEILIAESELIEDYLEGTLTDAERASFENNFLVTEERRERLNEIRLLKRFSSGPHRFELKDEEVEPTPSWLKIKWLVPVFNVVLIGAIGLVIWQVMLADGLSPLESKYAGLNERDLADPNEIAGIASATIYPNTFRNGGAVPVVETAGQGDSILFRLPLSFDVAAGASFKVEMVSCKSKFSIESAKVYRKGSVNEVVFLAPRSAVEKGSGRISLTSNSEQHAPIVYNFEAR